MRERKVRPKEAVNRDVNKAAKEAKKVLKETGVIGRVIVSKKSGTVRTIPETDKNGDAVLRDQD